MGAPMESVTKRSSVNTVTLRRGLRLLDAMLLVVAAAMGCRMTLSVCHASKRPALDEFCELLLEWSAETWWAYAQKPLALAVLAMPLITMISLALIPIRLRGHRPRWRLLARQPGLLAMSAVALAIVFVGFPTVLAAATAGATWESLVRLLITEWRLWDLTILGGLAILVSWMTLLVGRSWRAEPSGVDQMGRALGVFWIVAGFAVWAALFFVMIGGTDCRARLINPSMIAVLGQKLLRATHLTMPLVALATLAVIPIRLLGSRSKWCRLTHQPGLLAACAVAVTMALAGLPVVVVEVAFGAGWMETLEWAFDEDNVTLVTKYGGLAVSASWMTLLVGRRWRAESSWVDRLGRGLGICWIVAALAVATSNVLIETEYLLTAGHGLADYSSIQTAMLERISRPDSLA